MIVQLTINGVEVQDTSLRAKSLRSDWPISARQTLSFDLFSPSPRPQIEQDVILWVDGLPLFGGIVYDADEIGRGDDRDVVCKVRAGNYAVLADGPMLNGLCPQQTLKERLQLIRDRQLVLIGVTINPAQPDGPILPATAYPWKKLREVLDDLSTQTGYFWEVNPQKQLGMFPGGSRAAPFALDESNILADGIQQKRTRANYINRVWVLFGSGSASDVTYKTKGNGTRLYPLPYFVASTVSQVFVDGVLHVVGTYPDSAWTWTYNPEDNSLNQRADQPLLGAANVIETAPFPANWPGAVHADSVSGANESATKLEYPDVFDYETAQSLANGALRRLEGLPRTFSVLTYSFGLQPGMTVPVTCALYGLSATQMLVTNVQIQHVGTERSNGNPWLLSRVDLVEGNETKGNWIAFWDAAMQTGSSSSASVAGGTVIPPAGPAGPSYFVASLGGSTTVGVTGTAWSDVPDAQYVKLPAGISLVADVRVLARYGASSSAQVRIWNATAGAVATTPISVTAATWQSVSQTFTATADNSYVLQVKGNDAGMDVLATGNVHPV